MKGIKKIANLLVLTVALAGTSFTTHAATGENLVAYSIDVDDTFLSEVVVLSDTSHEENGRLITTKVYQQEDGTLITDVLNVSAVAARSKNGSDTATRTRTISEWGTITITASFSWYTKGAFSYVKCTSMSASHSLDANAVVSKWEKSYTKDYVSIGKATAQVEYYFYNSKIPVQHQEGTFKITCSDSGTISDNS